MLDENNAESGGTAARGDDPVSFERDIRILFRPIDVQCMNQRNILLLNYEWMSDLQGNHGHTHHANAHQVYGYLTGAKTPRMPYDGNYWSDGNLALFKKWMDDGYLP